MKGSVSRKVRPIVTSAVAVVLSVSAVVFVAYASTFITTSSVGIATDTPGVSLSTKGAGLFEGFVSANYFTSTSTNPSWLLNSQLGLGTSTPSGTLGRGGLAAEGTGLFGNFVYTSFLTATSTTATSTLKGGAAIGTTNLVSDANSGNFGVGTSSWPVVINNAAASAGYKTGVAIGAGTASSTVYIAGGASVGSSIILKSTDGTGCIAIMATRGASAIDASVVLSAKVVSCPQN